MKTNYKTLSLALFSLAFLDASVSSLSAQTPTLRPALAEFHEVQVSRGEPTEAETFADADFPFFKTIRAWRGPEAYDTLVESTGWGNLFGWYTTKDYQLVYITEILLDENGAPVMVDENGAPVAEGGQPVPLKADVYLWREASYFNGNKVWTAAYGEFDAAAGTLVGYWWNYGEDDPSSRITGAGSLSSFDTGEQFFATDVTGWILAPVESGEKRGRGRKNK